MSSQKLVVELSDKDIALASEIIANYGQKLERLGTRVQVSRIMRIADIILRAPVWTTGACYCCGKGSATLLPCTECGVLLCQDCALPTGSHVCDIGGN